MGDARVGNGFQNIISNCYRKALYILYIYICVYIYTIYYIFYLYLYYIIYI